MMKPSPQAALFTVASLRALIEVGFEKAYPQTAIRAYLASREGKKLTAADEPKLRAAAKDGTIGIRKSAGMTHIEWGGYSRTGGREGGSLLIAYTVQAPVIVMADFDRFNVAHFGAAEERNTDRDKAIADEATLAKLADALNAKIATDAALATMLAYGEPVAVARHAIEDSWKAITSALGTWPR